MLPCNSFRPGIAISLPSKKCESSGDAGGVFHCSSADLITIGTER